MRIQLKDYPVYEFYDHYNEQLKTVSDRYLSLYWDKDTDEELGQALRQVYWQLEGVRKYRANIAFEDMEYQKKIVDDLEKLNIQLPKYQVIREEHLSKYFLGIDVEIESQITQESKEIHIQNIYHLIEFYKSRGITIATLWVGFYEKEGEIPTDIIHMLVPQLKQENTI